VGRQQRQDQLRFVAQQPLQQSVLAQPGECEHDTFNDAIVKVVTRPDLTAFASAWESSWFCAA
jgi:hypothetical protein